MQSVYPPQNQMANSFKPQYSQAPPQIVQPMNNIQFAGTQSTYPTQNQFQFKHEQDPNFRSNSYILNRDQQIKTSVIQTHEQNAELRSTSYLPVIQNQQREPMKQSIVMDPKDKPLHTLQEFEFNKQIQPQAPPILIPQQPPVVTTYPERPLTYIPPTYDHKKREEYCGLFTSSKPEGYQKGKLSQNDNEEKENEYWLCMIF